ncbi:hypothetical protein [Haloglomus litoreum]|uniref:hypothetical protein n=1 Tax=Haloglomus litoreum TaxID=3034026 RepID=UPI0023E837D7|nr:hypothetical protein [Haloglomus sp. DT116]
MGDGQRIDWRAVPARYRAWQALPLWRKVLWLVVRSVTIVVLYLGAAAAILWYNEPAVVGAMGAGREPVWALFGVLSAQPELLLLLLILGPAVAAAVLLPHKPDW